MNRHKPTTGRRAAELCASLSMAGALVAAACSSPPRPTPAPTPVAVQWCVDDDWLIQDDIACQVDWDFDGDFDGHYYVPPPGLTRPSRGHKLLLPTSAPRPALTRRTVPAAPPAPKKQTTSNTGGRSGKFSRS